MKRFSWILLLLLSIPVAAEDAEEEKGPRIIHEPVIRLCRGVPAIFRAQIKSEGESITSAVVRVKAQIVDPVVTFPMADHGTNLYQSIVPVDWYGSIHRFFYSIAAADSAGETNGTPWLPVQVINCAEAASTVAGAGGGGGKALLIGGAVLLVGGTTAAIIENNNDDGGGGPKNAPTETGNEKSGGGGSSNDRPRFPNFPPAPPEEPEEPEPCVLTGNETVSYSGEYIFDESPIVITICYTCSNATISASTTWGESDTIPNAPNDDCQRNNAVLILNEPSEPDCAAEYETISVFSNGQLIDTLLWPRPDDAAIAECF